MGRWPSTMVVWKAQPLITLPRNADGVDWGRPRQLVARDGTKSLFWVPGHTAWVSQGQSGYYPGKLVILDGSDPLVIGKRLAEGGRLSSHLKNGVVLRKIADFFGCQCSDLPIFQDKITYTT